MIKLYTWGTPNGNKLHIMLEETGTPYELIPVNLGKGEQRDPAFLKINPNGKIPAIVDTDGPGGQPLTLAESGAILVYLADKTGQCISSVARERMATLQWIMFQMSHVGPMIGQLHHFMASAPLGNEYAIERYRKEGERLMDVLDGRLKESSYLASADYSIADIAMWPWVRSLVHTTKQELGARRSLIRWFENIEQRPATRKAIDIYNSLRSGANKLDGSVAHSPATYSNDGPGADLQALPSASRESFLAAMGRIFSLIAIITTDGPAGRFAITVNSVTSASADPPVVLACINRRSPLYDAIRANGVFCLNVLAIGQEHLSDCFAGRPRDGMPFDFASAQWTTGTTGAPVLTGAVASFDSILHASQDVGTHTVFFGRVLEVSEDGAVPLIYGSRCYARPDTGV